MTILLPLLQEGIHEWSVDAHFLNVVMENERRHVLLISDSETVTTAIVESMAESDLHTLVARTDEQAVNYVLNEHVLYIVIDASLVDISCKTLIDSLRINSGDRHIPIILLVSSEDDAQPSNYLSSGCDDVLFKPFTSLALHTRISLVDKTCEFRKLYKGSINEQLLAKRILTNAINERSVRLDEIGILSLSKDVFSGDLFITARHPDGSLSILIADFTGHGLSAAVGALPVADTFSVMTRKGFELGFILESINSKLHTLLPTNMFMACSVLNVSTDLKQVKIWNGGMPDIYIRKLETGKVQHTIKSSHIPLGITDVIENENEYDLKTVELTPGDQLILFTDGLTDALNADDEMFGEQRLQDCLEINCKDESIFTTLVNTFNAFCGDSQPLDDVTLACVPCTEKLMNMDDTETTNLECFETEGRTW